VSTKSGKDQSDEDARLPAVGITGQVASRGRNVVLVGDVERKLKDKSLALLLRLVVALDQSEKCDVKKERLGRAIGLKADGIEQGISRLRQDLLPGKDGRDPHHLVRISREGWIRLFVPREGIKYNKERLMNHDNQYVRKWAGKLR
jgi:hypothetical protein